MERLRWLLRLRWLVVPLFSALELASGLLLGRRAPWAPVVAAAGLLALNAAYTVLLARRPRQRALVRFARLDAALVVAVPIGIALCRGDPADPIRYGVLIGVVAAAAVLPRAHRRRGDRHLGDLWPRRSRTRSRSASTPRGSRTASSRAGPWRAGVVGTVAILACWLHHLRCRASARAHALDAFVERSRLEWDATLDALSEMVVITDEDGVVERANRAFAALVGGRPHEVAGRPLATLLAGHPERWWSARSGGIVEVDDPIFDSQYEITVTRVGDRILRVASDVGEQRRLYARLVQADKLASVGVLASGVAHEINNPTASVTSNLAELKRYWRVYDQAVGELAEAAMAAGAADRAGARRSSGPRSRSRGARRRGRSRRASTGWSGSGRPCRTCAPSHVATRPESRSSRCRSAT